MAKESATGIESDCFWGADNMGLGWRRTFEKHFEELIYQNFTNLTKCSHEKVREPVSTHHFLLLSFQRNNVAINTGFHFLKISKVSST